MKRMVKATRTTHVRFWLWLIRVIGVIVPRRLRADWRQEWEAELHYRETLLAVWDKLNWQTKLDLLWRSTSAFWDALWLRAHAMQTSLRTRRARARGTTTACMIDNARPRPVSTYLRQTWPGPSAIVVQW